MFGMERGGGESKEASGKHDVNSSSPHPQPSRSPSDHNTCTAHLLAAPRWAPVAAAAAPPHAVASGALQDHPSETRMPPHWTWRTQPAMLQSCRRPCLECPPLAGVGGGVAAADGRHAASRCRRLATDGHRCRRARRLRRSCRRRRTLRSRRESKGGFILHRICRRHTPSPGLRSPDARARPELTHIRMRGCCPP